MNLLDFIDLYNTDRLHIKPHINEGKLANATERICTDLDADDEILLLLDDSAFSDGGVGVAITHRFIYIKESFSEPVKCDLREIDYIWAAKTRLLYAATFFINGEEAFSTNISVNLDTAKRLCEGINAYLKALRSQNSSSNAEFIAAATIATAATAASAASMTNAEMSANTAANDGGILNELGNFASKHTNTIVNALKDDEESTQDETQDDDSDDDSGDDGGSFFDFLDDI